MFLSGGLPLILLEAEDSKWWATLLMYYKLMFIQLTFIPLNSISQKGGPPLIPISVVLTVSNLLTNIYFFGLMNEKENNATLSETYKCIVSFSNT